MFSQIENAGFASSDRKIGNFTSLTIDRNADSKYIDGYASEAITERQNLISQSPKIRQIQLWLTPRMEQKPLPMDDKDMPEENAGPHAHFYFFTPDKSKQINSNDIKVYPIRMSS